MGSIIAISQERGSGGDLIGPAVAERLGYRFLDRELIHEAAREHGIPEASLSRVDETRPTLWERFSAETRRYTTSIKATIYSLAAEGRVVLMGRGGAVLLRDVSHALRVRIMAPMATRVARLVKEGALDPGAAEWAIKQSDRERAARMRYLYDVSWTDPELYHVTLNTGALSAEMTVEVLARAVALPALQPTTESVQVLRDLALAARVEMALLTDLRMATLPLTVRVQGGEVTLKGMVDRALPQTLLRETAAKVPGVKQVTLELTFMPPTRTVAL